MLSKKWCLIPSFPFMSWSESRWWYSCDRESERLLVPMVLLQANPSLSQSNANWHADNKPSTEQDRIHGCHCMSVPFATQNTQYVVCGLAHATHAPVASDKMALFTEAMWRHCLCGWIMQRCRHLQFNDAKVLSFVFDHVKATSFAGAQHGPGRVAGGKCQWQCQVALTG
jgi:hypothetical protein